MSRAIVRFLLVSCILAAPVFGAPQQKTASEEKAKDPFAGFFWLSSGSETRGLKYDTGRLANLKVARSDEPQAEIESVVKRPDPNTMLVTRKVYSPGANGERQLVEVVTEELRASAGDKISATRTLSRLDSNGRMMVARKDTQVTAPAGPGEFRTEATIQMANVNRGIAASERIVQVERKKGDDVYEIDRTQSLPNPNGGWGTGERRVSATRVGRDSSATEEEVYGQDANGKLSLKQKVSSKEWKDRRGQEVQDTDTYIADLQGKLTLDTRSNIVQATSADGTTQTTQTVQQKSPINPMEGLRLIEKITQTVRPVDPSRTETDTYVVAPDSNGAMVTVSFTKAVEVK